MKRFLSPVLATVLLGPGLHAQTAPDAPELTQLLKQFLDGASRNDAATHDRFWAEDLIYTRSAGRRVGKADVIRDVRAAPAPQPGDAKTTYHPEDVRVQQYGHTAIVAFRLVGTTEKDGRTQVANFLNTGTFVKRDGQWRAVGWQATRMPRPEEEASKEAAAAEAAFHRALLAADVKALEGALDPGFVWTHRTGERQTRPQLLDQLRSGQLKYSRLETKDVTVAVHGDAAVVRGVSPRQRSAIPGAGGADAQPFDAFFTLTLVSQDGAWKAVALHTSRPQ